MTAIFKKQITLTNHNLLEQQSIPFKPFGQLHEYPLIPSTHVFLPQHLCPKSHSFMSIIKTIISTLPRVVILGAAKTQRVSTRISLETIDITCVVNEFIYIHQKGYRFLLISQLVPLKPGKQEHIYPGLSWFS